MKDMKIKGTGNSRFLKSNIPAGTTIEQLIAMLNAGTFPFDFNGVNAEGIEEMGSALNKANLLKDETALALGLDENAIPDDALTALLNLNKQNSEEIAASLKIETGSYKGTGTGGSANPSKLTFGITPYLVIIHCTGNGDHGFFIKGNSYASCFGTGGDNYNAAGQGWRLSGVTWSGKTLSWYTTTTSTGISISQLNSDSYTYSYIAIGL